MKDLGITNTLKIIYDLLPLHAEEGGEAFSVNVRDSLSKVGSDNTETSTALSLVEQLFISLGLLDETLLEHGVWRFKSFPASLMARSVLSSLADKNQSLFSKGFWGAQSDLSDSSEGQRKVLDYLEGHRQKHHQASAKPIRYVHVAWGLICVDGKFLLHHREDKNRTNESNYVLVGGKVSQNDLMVADNALNANDAIKQLQSPDASSSLKCIQVGLDREMSEETGLEQETHYGYSHWRTLKPYTNVGGVGAVRAITEYHIHVYHIELNQDGMLALSKKIQEDEKLVWFTAEELINAKSQDGKMAYIPALIEDFETAKDWGAAISDFPPSYDTSVNNLSDSYSVTIPLDSKDDVHIGKTGKEKPLSCDLTKEEHKLLLSLSLYAKDPDVRAKSESIHLLNSSWVEIEDEELNAVARELTIKLRKAEAPLIDGYKERYYRLALPADYVYFQNDAFTYRVEDSPEKKTQLIVARETISTDLVESSSIAYTKEIAGALKVGLNELMNGKEVSGDTQKDLDTFKKNVQRLSSLNQTIGLRGLIRSVDSNFQLLKMRNKTN